MLELESLPWRILGAEDVLLPSLFFRTGETTSPDHLFSSIARSLAIKRESYCAILAFILEEAFVTMTFDEQFRKLVVELECLLCVARDIGQDQAGSYIAKR